MIVSHQVSCPLTCKVISTLQDLVPNRFDFVARSIPSKNVSNKRAFLEEIVNSAKSFPKINEDECTESLKIVKSGMCFPEIDGKSVHAFFYLACVAFDPVVYSVWKDDAKHDLQLFKKTMDGIKINRNSALRTLDHILTFLVRHEINDRYTIFRRSLSVPFYCKKASVAILVMLAHFHRDWVASFVERCRKKFVLTDVERCVQIMRWDVGLYCQALSRLPKKFCGSKFQEKFDREIWGENEVPEDSGRRALAFCSKWPVKVWKIMGWNVPSPEERRRMTLLAEKEKWSLSIDEAIDVCLYDV